MSIHPSTAKCRPRIVYTTFILNWKIFIENLFYIDTMFSASLLKNVLMPSPHPTIKTFGNPDNGAAPKLTYQQPNM